MERARIIVRGLMVDRVDAVSRRAFRSADCAASAEKLQTGRRAGRRTGLVRARAVRFERSGLRYRGQQDGQGSLERLRGRARRVDRRPVELPDAMLFLVLGNLTCRIGGIVLARR